MATKNQYSPQTVFHPGATLAEKLEELGMGPKEFAVRTGKPEKTITAILKGESSITPDMAIRFEDLLKIPAHFWLNSQRVYDEHIARLRRQEEVAGAIIWAKGFPVNDMTKKGWLPDSTTWVEKTAALLKFYCVATPGAWEDFWIKQELKVAFRISLTYTSNPQAISAWLRRGEIQAEELKAPLYSEKAFRESLSPIKALMAGHPANFFQQLQDLCLRAGVKVVHTPCLPKATCNGATRWLGNTPLIQLSGRYKRNDHFWFTFFHEAGHILLHGKKDVFLEIEQYQAQDQAREEEADSFAVKWTLSEKEESEIAAASIITVPAIRAFAKKFGTHPAIIIGRLQRNNRLPHGGAANKLFIPVDL